MIDVVWATQNYLFWLAGISLFCFSLERVWPWREQRVLRRGIGQDVFFLLFNDSISSCEPPDSFY